MNIYIYPKLPAVKTFSIFRIGGNGLANCMFVVAKSWILESKLGCKIIEPTWLNVNIGTYLRKERDKRHYMGIFNVFGINGLKKSLLLLLGLNVQNSSITLKNNIRPIIINIEGINDFFQPLIPYHKLISNKFEMISKIKLSDYDFKYFIGIHIRLGDFLPKHRTSLEWYKYCICNINKITNSGFKFLLFSDGTDEELDDILQITNVERAFYGNAFVDILALSKCELILASDSTFSGWGAFLGQKMVLFNKKHYGRVLIDEKNEVILNINQELPDNVKAYLTKIIN